MSEIAVQENRPWERPFWKPAPGKSPVLFFLVLIHVLAIIGLILFPLPGWRIFLSALALVWVGGIGTTVCYHRAITHRALKLNPKPPGMIPVSL